MNNQYYTQCSQLRKLYPHMEHTMFQGLKLRFNIICCLDAWWHWQGFITPTTGRSSSSLFCQAQVPLPKQFSLSSRSSSPFLSLSSSFSSLSACRIIQQGNHSLWESGSTLTNVIMNAADHSSCPQGQPSCGPAPCAMSSPQAMGTCDQKTAVISSARCWVSHVGLSA